MAVALGGHAPGWPLVGVGGDRLTAIGVDLLDGTPAFLIAARRAPAAARAAGHRGVVSGGRGPGAGDDPASFAPVRAGRPGRCGRRRVRPGTEVLRDAIAAGGPLVVLVDDAELLRDAAASAELSEIVRRTYPSWQSSPPATRTAWAPASPAGRSRPPARRGLLLSPQNLADADLIGVRIARTSIGNPIEPGRGLLHLGTLSC